MSEIDTLRDLPDPDTVQDSPVEIASVESSRDTTEDSRQARRTTFLFLLRAAVGTAILALIVYRLDLSQTFHWLSGISWQIWSVAVLLFYLIQTAWTVRWQEVLRATGIRRGFRDLLALVLISVFFSSFLPSLVGGDLVRGFYVSKKRGNVTTSYSALFIERFVGLVTLGGMSAAAAVVALLAYSPFLPNGLLLGVGSLGLLMVITGMLLFAWRGWHQRLASLTWLGHKASQVATELSAALELFHRPGTRTVRIIVASLALQILVSCYHLAGAHAVGLDSPPLVFFIVVPVSAVAAMAPITLNGLGIREGVLAGLMIQTGVAPSKAGAFALLMLATSTLLVMPGGIFFFLRTGPRPLARKAPPPR